MRWLLASLTFLLVAQAAAGERPPAVDGERTRAECPFPGIQFFLGLRGASDPFAPVAPEEDPLAAEDSSACRPGGRSQQGAHASAGCGSKCNDFAGGDCNRCQDCCKQRELAADCKCCKQCDCGAACKCGPAMRCVPDCTCPQAVPGFPVHFGPPPFVSLDDCPGCPCPGCPPGVGCPVGIGFEMAFPPVGSHCRVHVAGKGSATGVYEGVLCHVDPGWIVVAEENSGRRRWVRSPLVEMVHVLSTAEGQIQAHGHPPVRSAGAHRGPSPCPYPTAGPGHWFGCAGHRPVALPPPPHDRPPFAPVLRRAGAEWPPAPAKSPNHPAPPAPSQPPLEPVGHCQAPPQPCGAQAASCDRAVPAGHRVVSLAFPESAPGSHLWRPGQCVDVLAHLKNEYGMDEAVTRTVVRGARIHSLHGYRDGDVRIKHVSLSVSPQAAERVAHAGLVGQVSLILAPEADGHVAAGEGTTACDLVQPAPADSSSGDCQSWTAAPPVAPAPTTVEAFPAPLPAPWPTPPLPAPPEATDCPASAQCPAPACVVPSTAPPEADVVAPSAPVEMYEISAEIVRVTADGQGAIISRPTIVTTGRRKASVRLCEGTQMAFFVDPRRGGPYVTVYGDCDEDNALAAALIKPGGSLRVEFPSDDGCAHQLTVRLRTIPAQAATPLPLDAPLVQKVYAVGDLVSPIATPQSSGKPRHAVIETRVDYDPLIGRITTSVDPHSWSATGGRGTIAAFPTNLSLVVSQTEENHERIAELLEEIRQAEAGTARVHFETLPLQ